MEVQTAVVLRMLLVVYESVTPAKDGEDDKERNRFERQTSFVVGYRKS